MLINLGTPDAPQTAEVRRYLREFLSDPRVIDVPAPVRWMILNLFILPFRPKKSAEAYRKIWTDEGSPLLVYGEQLAEQLQARVGDEALVALAMRYQSPSIESALAKLVDAGVERIIALPLFPQYSSAAWGSAAQKLYEVAGEGWNVPSIEVIPPFYDHPAFIEAFAAQARPVLAELKPDKTLMSFHGVPERHCTKSDPTGAHCLQRPDCCDAIVEANRMCYRAQCFATAHALARELQLEDDAWEITFQSRLGRTPWIQPFTDERIKQLPGEGVKRVAVLSPAFVADCLETLEEIAMGEAETFVEHGGERLELVPSLNASAAWVDAVVTLFEEHLGRAPGEVEAASSAAVA